MFITARPLLQTKCNSTLVSSGAFRAHARCFCNVDYNIHELQGRRPEALPFPIKRPLYAIYDTNSNWNLNPRIYGGKVQSENKLHKVPIRITLPLSSRDIYVPVTDSSEVITLMGILSGEIVLLFRFFKVLFRTLQFFVITDTVIILVFISFNYYVSRGDWNN